MNPLWPLYRLCVFAPLTFSLTYPYPSKRNAEETVKIEKFSRRKLN
jgi:hypothetical protein